MNNKFCLGRKFLEQILLLFGRWACNQSVAGGGYENRGKTPSILSLLLFMYEVLMTPHYNLKEFESGWFFRVSSTIHIKWTAIKFPRWFEWIKKKTLINVSESEILIFCWNVNFDSLITFSHQERRFRSQQNALASFGNMIMPYAKMCFLLVYTVLRKNVHQIFNNQFWTENFNESSDFCFKEI